MFIHRVNIKKIKGLNINNVSSKWTPAVLDTILKNETYTGTLIQNKTGRISHKIHNTIRKTEDEWIKVKDTHEAIIDVKNFKQVNNMLYNRQLYTNSEGKTNVYTGYLKCSDCNHNLSRFVNGKYIYYYCSTYKKRNCALNILLKKMN